MGKGPHPARCATFPGGEGTLTKQRELSLLPWRSCREATEEVPLAQLDSVLTPLHHLDKTLEQIMAILRSGTGFGVVLD